MQWSEIQFNPRRETLRQFAGLWLAFFGTMSLRQVLIVDRPALGLILGAVALAFGGLGLARPGAVRFLYVGWMVLAFPVGWLISQTMLALLFFGLYTPIGLVFRLLRRDTLKLGRSGESKSYWRPKPTPDDIKRYFKQF